jgi:DNA-binding transcriptional LysR family regulator
MNNIKQISSLLIFSEVANKQSFTLAAKHLGMSKSAISQKIKRLEQDIGQQLLSRNTRGMSLTATGEKLLGRCELLRGQVDLAFEELNHSKEAPSGTFSLSIPHLFEKDIVIPAISQLCVEFPNIEPNILVTDEAKDLIKNKLDVAIYGGDLKDSNYRALPIGNIQEYFCATPTYIQKQGELTKIDDLIKHSVIAAPWQKDCVAVYKNSTQNDKKLINLKYFAKTNTLPSTFEMVLHNMGLALLPEFIIQSEVSSGRLVRILPEYQGRQWSFYMVHRFQGKKPIHIDRFYQLVKHFFSKVNNKI